MSVTPSEPRPDSDVVEVILKALDRSPEPLSLPRIQGQLPRPYRLPVDRLEPLVAGLVAAGRLHTYAPYKDPKKLPRYWTRDRGQYARDTLLEALTSRPRNRSDLLKAVKTKLQGYPQAQVEQTLRDLKDEGLVRELPPFVRSRAARRLSTRPPDLREYLGDALGLIRRDFHDPGLTDDRLLDAAREVLRGAREGAVPEAVSESPPPAPESINLPGLILDRMTEVEPAADDGRLVSVRDLRAAVIREVARQVGIDLFDRAVLDLARRGAVELHRHDYPASLSDEQRAEMVTDGNGQYFVAIARRA